MPIACNWLKIKKGPDDKSPAPEILKHGQALKMAKRYGASKLTGIAITA